MRFRGTPLPHPIFAAKTARPQTWQRCACKDGFCRKSALKRQNKHYKRLFCKIVAFAERRKYYADIRKISPRTLPVSPKFSAFRPKEKRQEKISSRYLLTKIGLISPDAPCRAGSIRRRKAERVCASRRALSQRTSNTRGFQAFHMRCKSASNRARMSRTNASVSASSP